jgi:hypothetical protein
MAERLYVDDSERRNQGFGRVVKLVAYLERRRVLRSTLTFIGKTGGGNVRMTEPLLDLRDVGPVFESVGCGLLQAQTLGPHSGRPFPLCLQCSRFRVLVLFVLQ